MLAYIKGELTAITTEYVVIEAGGLGYKVFMPETAIERLGEIGKTVKVHTYYKVREDDISIFGFNTQEELRMFELLLSVSGVGAKTAVVIISTIEPSNFAFAVISEDISELVKIPGIGKKSAQRIVLELKDKLKKEAISVEADTKVNNKASNNNDEVKEAMSALQVLGYTNKEIEKAFEKIEKADNNVEELIKKGLAMLSRN
ncbi:MAG: Holliday junction branch migration protein RuvA [Clostridia bacterium]|nr:Holliday junction branch migration protein RuvA [Clostridia bacterium]